MKFMRAIAAGSTALPRPAMYLIILTMQAVPHVIVLAAGASRRLGEPKQLVKIGGRPLLHRVVSNATSLAGHAVTVVLG
ncbi:MAG TPA: NTP transferase domain-containing protein, partial [Steroidobacteraceae bacterium]|nr:NTP transferase domain-containing protein [Steroidobacteraceae bacterium]